MFPTHLKSDVLGASLWLNKISILGFLSVVIGLLYLSYLCLHSQVTISGFDLTSYRDCLTKWSSAVETMFSQCQAAGEARCLPVRYEQLVLHTEDEMRKLLHFLELQWDSSVLRHEELIGKAGGVSLSK